VYYSRRKTRNFGVAKKENNGRKKMKNPKKYPVLIENRINGAKGIAWVVNSRAHGSRVVVRVGSNTFDYFPGEFEKVWRLEGQKNPKILDYRKWYIYKHSGKIGDLKELWYKGLIDEEELKYFAGKMGWDISDLINTTVKSNPSSSLYESFHGMPPKVKRKVHYTNPKGTLLSIGTVTRIDYIPGKNSKHRNITFYHKSGDTGEEKLKSNWILATDAKGENFFLLKKDESSKFPRFSDRGILG
jgi:hypothetical protein